MIGNRMDENDNQLINNYLHSKNEKFLKDLFSKHVRSLYMFINCKVGNRIEVDDVVQEVLIKVWQNLNKFDQKQKFKNWLYKIANNIVIDRWRVKKEEVELDEVSEIENDCELDDVIDQQLDFKKINTILDQINPNQRLVISLYYFEELSFSEIADVLNEPLNTVKSRLFRGVQQIKKLIDG